MATQPELPGMPSVLNQTQMASGPKPYDPGPVGLRSTAQPGQLAWGFSSRGETWAGPDEVDPDRPSLELKNYTQRVSEHARLPATPGLHTPSGVHNPDLPDDPNELFNYGGRFNVADRTIRQITGRGSGMHDTSRAVKEMWADSPVETIGPDATVHATQKALHLPTTPRFSGLQTGESAVPGSVDTSVPAGSLEELRHVEDFSGGGHRGESHYQMVKNPDPVEDGDDMPWVYNIGGQYYPVDGNHRTAVQRNRGDGSFQARVRNIAPGNEGIDSEGWEVEDMVSKQQFHG